MGKAVGTLSVWIGVACVGYVFNSAGLLDSTGAGWMFFGGVIMTAWIWNK